MDAVNVKISAGEVEHVAVRVVVRAVEDEALIPEGHGIRYDSDGRVIGVSIINARWLLERDGHVTITLPHDVQVAARDLAGALS
jgi:uncharacterized protein YuzE